jgi:DNA-binding SARP family transcriptional activator
MWRFRLLGDFAGQYDGKTLGKFRSKSCLSLLCFLLVNPEGALARWAVEESIWPDSEPERQGQNLRKALSDIRKEIREVGGTDFLIVDRDRVSLDSDLIQTDLDELRAALRNRQIERVCELYSGELLPWLQEHWLVSVRISIENAVGEAVAEKMGELRAAGEHRTAINLGLMIAHTMPTREDLRVELIRSYGELGQNAEAIRIFEELEHALEDLYGESPSEDAIEAVENLPRFERRALISTQSPNATKLDQEDIKEESGGGGVPLDSPYYVPRQCDFEIDRAYSDEEATLLIQGPRQVGKTSLLSRLADRLRRDGNSVCYFDFQSVGREQITSEEKLYQLIAYRIAKDVEVSLDVKALWNDWLGANTNLDEILEQILHHVPGRLALIFDESDRMMDSPFCNDFFGLLRSWHNRRTTDGDRGWSKLTVAIGYATEARLFIRDLNQSPFNVGRRIGLADFTFENLEDLNHRYQNPLKGEEIEELLDLTGGQPYLSRISLNEIKREGRSLADIEALAESDAGPFGEHLRRLQMILRQDPALITSMRGLLNGELEYGSDETLRLYALGICRNPYEERIAFRSRIYRNYFSIVLGRERLTCVPNF